MIRICVVLPGYIGYDNFVIERVHDYWISFRKKEESRELQSADISSILPYNEEMVTELRKILRLEHSDMCVFGFEVSDFDKIKRISVYNSAFHLIRDYDSSDFEQYWPNALNNKSYID